MTNFAKRQSLHKAVVTISGLWISSLAGAGCAFATQIMLARTLGPSAYGQFSASLALVTLLGTFASFGIPSVLIKVFGAAHANATLWTKPIYALTATTTVIAYSIYLAWNIYGNYNYLEVTLAIYLAPIILSVVVTELVCAKFQVETQHRKVATFQLFQHLMRLVLIGLAIWSSATLNDRFIHSIVYGSVGVLVACVGIYSLRGGVKLVKNLTDVHSVPPDNYSKISVSQVLKEAWPFSVANFCSMAYFQLGVIILTHLANDEIAGHYNAAITIMMAAYLLPTVIYQKFLLSKLHYWSTHDPIKFLRVYRFGNICMLVLGTITLLAVALVGPWLIVKLLGVTYAKTATLLPWMSICAPLRFLAMSAGSVLVTQNNISRKTAIMSVAILCNAFFYVIIVPVYGVVGAIISSIISDLILLILYFTAVRKYVFTGATNNGWLFHFQSSTKK
ncbi:oligosaccharide flippase family protein [Massilia varians]|uniref:oligosaccharide flippase family protein n=1 Tax=Massilia varians TaxID=457921 RepID=UPI002491DAB2|nr:oligosaccharide flippase family protein [Massilia varians]